MEKYSKKFSALFFLKLIRGKFLDQDDIFNVLVKLQTRSAEIFGERNKK